MSSNDYPPNTGQPHKDNGDVANDDLSDDAIAEAIAKSADEPLATNDEATTAENEKLKDQVLRLAAELENTRRRAERDKVDVGRYAIANFARDLLGVADNFERALQVATTEQADVENEALSSVVAGLRMTEKELINVFERHGVKKIAPQGEKFDPNIHQAVAQIPGGDIPAGHVVDVAQPGFVIKDRVLRAAMVTVSNGQSAPAAAPEDQAGTPTSVHIDTKA